MRALRAFAPPGEGQSEPRHPPAAAPMPPAGRWTDLTRRIAAGIVLIAFALLALVKGGALFALSWYVASLVVHWEWQRMVGGERTLLRFLIGAVALAAATYVTLTLVASRDAAIFALSTTPFGSVLFGEWTLRDVAVLVFFASVLALAGAAGPGKRLWSAGGLFYAAALVVSVCLLRFSVFDGYRAVLWLFAVVWGSDVMAYFGGRLIGGRKLVPRVSPSKTWSGALTGLICGSLIGVGILDLAAPLGETAGAPVLFFGLLIAAVSQAGDLFESVVKRHFGVKDTSRLIPGHGGVMDRLDGFTAASTFAALFGLAKAGSAAAAAHGLFYW